MEYDRKEKPASVSSFQLFRQNIRNFLVIFKRYVGVFTLKSQEDGTSKSVNRYRNNVVYEISQTFGKRQIILTYATPLSKIVGTIAYSILSRTSTHKASNQLDCNLYLRILKLKLYFKMKK